MRPKHLGNIESIESTWVFKDRDNIIAVMNLINKDKSQPIEGIMHTRIDEITHLEISYFLLDSLPCLVLSQIRMNFYPDILIVGIFIFREGSFNFSPVYMPYYHSLPVSDIRSFIGHSDNMTMYLYHLNNIVEGINNITS